MLSFRAVFPELTDAEYDENIRPLEAWGDTVLQVLEGGAIDPDVAGWVAETEDYPFQRFLRGLAAQSLVDFPQAVVDTAFAPGNNAQWIFLERIEARLGKVMIRSLVAAVNKAGREGRLDGDTPEARYDSFLETCCASGIEKAAGLRFPVLERQHEQVVRLEVSFLCELAVRIAGDRRAIAELFAIDTSVGLVSYSADAGDTHNGGRGVCVLDFEDGQKLVYKPRNISGEHAFGKIAEGFDHAFGIQILHARCLSYDHYGYVEFVHAASSRGDLEVFLRQSGELLALLFLLNARDMHYENVIRTDAGPVAIDLETIMHPARVFDGPISIAEGNAGDLVERSVAAIGILPMIVRGANEDEYVDLGFLGGHQDAISPFRALRFDRPFTDHVTLIFAHTALPDRPPVTSEEREEDVISLGLAMAESFERTLRRVLTDTAAWLDLLGEHASDLWIRYIHNPTVVYDRALRLTSSAQAMVQPEYATALLGRIALHSGDSDQALVRSEMRQLAERDVPYFLVHSAGRDVVTGDREPTGALTAASPLEDAKVKIAELDDRAIKREANMIRMAFVAKFPDDSFGKSCSALAQGVGVDERTLAIEIATEIAESTLPDRFDHLPETWIGPLVSTETDQPWITGALGYDLYTGRTGPALALLAAGQALGKDRFLETGTSIFDKSAAILLDGIYEERTLRQIGVGAFTGLAGMAYGLHSAARITGVERWDHAAAVISTVIEELLGDPTQGPPARDIISGTPGVILALRGLATEQSVSLCRTLGVELAHLVLDDSPDLQPLLMQSGLAHGLSGLVLALCETANLGAEQSEVRAAVDKLMTQLEQFYVPDVKRWKSRRDDRFTYTTGWCHGAAGVGLALDARLRAFGTDLDIEARLQDAVDAIGVDGFGRNLTWCHGDLGNHDVLRTLAPRSPNASELLRQAEGHWLRPDNIAHGRLDMRSRYSYARSIMVGSAGILLHLLNRMETGFALSPTQLAVETSEV